MELLGLVLMAGGLLPGPPFPTLAAQDHTLPQGFWLASLPQDFSLDSQGRTHPGSLGRWEGSLWFS